jgi:glucose-6-phosphate-specific signal transduction histidine kinase
VTPYFVVSEALTNAVKYSNASFVHLAAEATDGVLHLRSATSAWVARTRRAAQA